MFEFLFFLVIYVIIFLLVKIPVKKIWSYSSFNKESLYVDTFFLSLLLFFISLFSYFSLFWESESTKTETLLSNIEYRYIDSWSDKIKYFTSEGKELQHLVITDRKVNKSYLYSPLDDITVVDSDKNKFWIITEITITKTPKWYSSIFTERKLSETKKTKYTLYIKK